MTDYPVNMPKLEDQPTEIMRLRAELDAPRTRPGAEEPYEASPCNLCDSAGRCTFACEYAESVGAPTERQMLSLAVGVLDDLTTNDEHKRVKGMREVCGRLRDELQEFLSELDTLHTRPGVEEIARVIARRFGTRTTGPGRHQAADEGYSPFPERRGAAYEDDNWPKFTGAAETILALFTAPPTEPADPTDLAGSGQPAEGGAGAAVSPSACFECGEHLVPFCPKCNEPASEPRSQAGGADNA